MKRKPKGETGTEERRKKPSSTYLPLSTLYSPSCPLFDILVHPYPRRIVSYVCHSSATPGQCPSFRYLPSNCSSFLCSSTVSKPETNISGWRMDLLRGTARKQDGRVDKGRRFFSSRVKERILSAAGYRLRYGLREEGGVADDDHRSFSSTIADGSSIDGKERTHGRSSPLCDLERKH